MRLKTTKKDVLRFKKTIFKNETNKEKATKRHWHDNEVKINMAAMGGFFSFNGTNFFRKKNQSHPFYFESKTPIIGFKTNLKHVIIETEEETFFFDYIVDEEEKKKPKATAEEKEELKSI